MDLHNRVVLVTGGSVRVGRAIALTLARRGADVVISYRRASPETAATLDALKRIGSRPLAVKADLSREVDIKRMFAVIQRAYGRLDVLVNSAAVFPRTPFDRLTAKDWDDTMAANLRGPFLCALYASRLMRRRRSGKIINMADWAGVRPYKDYLPYCVSKAGILGLTKALAKELAPHIQVAAVAPGPILPPPDMSRAAKARIAKRVPLKRWGSPQDIANTVAFLIEGTDFITGSTIFVDGGQLIA